MDKYNYATADSASGDHDPDVSTDSLFPYLGESAEQAAGESTSKGSADRRTIGEVVSSLQEEFPSLSVSKVRYLERRSLINLERTSGGYRLFSPEDVDLLRQILMLQENEYLPLEVIKQRIDRGIIPAENRDPDANGDAHLREAGREYTKGEICREVEADPGFIDELISVGVMGRGDSGNRVLTQRDLEVARLATEMSKYSIQPRHLRGIVAAVDREVAMFKQVLNPDLRSGDEQRVAGAMEKALHLASVDSRLKELIMAGAIESLDRS